MTTADEEMLNAATTVKPVSALVTQAKAAAAKLAAEKIPATPKPTVQPYTAADLRGSVHPPTYILRPLIPRGRLILMIGDSTAGKTPFQYQLIGSLLSQKDFLGFKNECEEPIRIGMLDAESLDDDIKFRIHLQASIWPEEIPTDRFVWTDRNTTPAMHLDVTLVNISKIKKFVEDHHLDLIFLDNLWALSGGQDISKGHIASPIITALNEIISLPWKPSIVLVHHKRKGSAGSDPEKEASILDADFMRWFQEMSGTMVWINRTDVRLGLARIEKNGNEYTVLRGRHRVPGGEQDIGPIYLSIDEKPCIAKISKSPDVLENLGPTKKAIADQMQKKRRFTKAEALQAGSGTIRGTASAKTVYRTLSTLKAHGFLIETNNGVYEWQDAKADDDAATAAPSQPNRTPNGNGKGNGKPKPNPLIEEIRKEHKENPEFTAEDIATELQCPPTLVRKVLKLPEPQAVPLFVDDL